MPVRALDNTTFTKEGVWGAHHLSERFSSNSSKTGSSCTVAESSDICKCHWTLILLFSLCFLHSHEFTFQALRPSCNVAFLIVYSTLERNSTNRDIMYFSQLYFLISGEGKWKWWAVPWVHFTQFFSVIRKWVYP